MNLPDVTLRPVDEATLDELVAVAVGDAEPADVMPPAPGGPGWTDDRVAAFRRFHRERRAGLDGPRHEVTLAVVAGGRVAGVLRLHRHGDGRHEVGAWLGRSWRGRGVGTAALAALRPVAAGLGVTEVVAETTAGNAAAQAMLTRAGATVGSPDADGIVRATLWGG
jgi:RimJ/RimL family protein N-acetyltransferase